MNSFSIQYRLHRPMIDLGELDKAATLPIIALDFDKQAFMEEKDYPHLHVMSGVLTRKLLVTHLGLPSFDVKRPEDLGSEYRNPAWKKLVSHIETFEQLALPSKLRTLALLRRLCFYPSILKLTEGVLDRPAQTHEEAMLLYEHVLALYLLGMDGLIEYRTDIAENAAKKAPIGSLAAAHLWYISCQQYVKFETNIPKLLETLPKYKAAVEALKGHISNNLYLEFRSRYHRFAAFGPQLKRDYNAMSAQMRLAEEFAESITVDEDDPKTKIVKDSVLFPLLESRIKEAIIREQWGLAQDRAERLISISPYSSMAHLHYAQVLAETSQYDRAVQEYLTAGRLHPMRAEIAYFMAGQCEQRQQRWEQALSYYFESLKYDEYGISTVECIIEVAQQQKDAVLLQWAEEYLALLNQEEDAGSGLMPYQGKLFGEEAPVPANA